MLLCRARGTTYTSRGDILHFFFKGICRWSLLGVTVAWQQVKVCREVYVFNIPKYHYMKCIFNVSCCKWRQTWRSRGFLSFFGGAVWWFSCLSLQHHHLYWDGILFFMNSIVKTEKPKQPKLFRSKIWPGIWYCIQHQC